MELRYLSDEFFKKYRDCPELMQKGKSEHSRRQEFSVLHAKIFFEGIGVVGAKRRTRPKNCLTLALFQSRVLF